ncbi:DNA polymerase B [Curvibacter phage P26059A]|nr:DNA polymerase B [Curvibacter phage P26059A]
MDYTRDFIYDIETFKDAFTFSIVRADGKFKQTFECSFRMNQIDRIFACMDYLHDNDFRMVGFNSKGFDYPIMHEILKLRGKLPTDGKKIARRVFRMAQDQIDSFKDGFGNTVKTADEYVKQVDLYRIWHFNNKARSTGLKMIEFNMRMNNIEDLPYDIHQELTAEHIDKIKQYNEHDVECTRQFYFVSESQIDFRDKLSIKLGRDFTNADDTKIGAEYFQMELEKAGVKLYSHRNGKRQMNQTHRPKIVVKDCLFNYYSFSRPEFQAIYEWFGKQLLTETKGVFSDIEEHDLGSVAQYAEMEVKKQRFKTKPTEEDIAEFMKQYPLGWIETEELKATEYLFDAEGNHVMQYPLDADGQPDFTKKQKKMRVPKKSYWGMHRQATTLNVLVDGYRIDFGVGGVHASLSDKVVSETKRYMVRDADVSSMYPNIAIANRIYPEHLGDTFCDIYKDMYLQRKSYDKKSAENAMLKLALNGTYGKSNDKYSVFYDPKFTMQITLNGQLSLLMLADRLLQIEGLRLVQLNTDGLTVAMLRETEDQYNAVCNQWQKDVGLDLEFVDYSKMYIRDVNNYYAVYTNGDVKRKGAYQYEKLGWHQNQSALVVQKAVEAAMVHGKDIRQFIEEHSKIDIMDFMLRTKVDRSSKLVLEYTNEDGSTHDVEQQRICRYYPSKSGGKLVKIMKPLEGSEDFRRLGIDTAWNIKTCNNMLDFDGDIDFEYYVNEAEKLLVPAKVPQPVLQ